MGWRTDRQVRERDRWIPGSWRQSHGRRGCLRRLECAETLGGNDKTKTKTTTFQILEQYHQYRAKRYGVTKTFFSPPLASLYFPMFQEVQKRTWQAHFKMFQRESDPTGKIRSAAQPESRQEVSCCLTLNVLTWSGGISLNWFQRPTGEIQLPCGPFIGGRPRAPDLGSP